MGNSDINDKVRQHKRQKVSVQISSDEHPVQTRSLAEDRQSERIELSEVENRNIIGKLENNLKMSIDYCTNNM